MKIVQMVSSLSYGDGVGNDVLAIDRILKENHFNTHIFALNIGNNISKGIAEPINDLPVFNKEDIVLYHFAIASKMDDIIKRIKCKKVLIYHNVTEPHFFKSYSIESYQACLYGKRQIQKMKNQFVYCLADSLFNKQELLNFGYKCPIEVLPIIIPFEDYKKKPSQGIINKYYEKHHNILFTGRVTPNKKHEDIIKIFYYYKKYYNIKSRLFFVGSYMGMEKYYGRLLNYISELELEDVIFTGHIPFEEILAYYHLANIFVCMSQHEGFCIPLLEAMSFRIPVLAYNATAIPDTLGLSGIINNSNEPMLNAGIINKVLSDKALSNKIVESQDERLKDFDYIRIGRMFLDNLRLISEMG